MINQSVDYNLLMMGSFGNGDKPGGKLGGNAGGDPRSRAQADFPSGWPMHAQSEGVINLKSRNVTRPFFPNEVALEKIRR